MESYRILVKRSAAGELAGAIPKRDRERVVQRIQGLACEPRPAGCRKLSARNLYRVRQGDYRIVYTVDDAKRVVEIFKIGPGSDIYRD